MWGSVAVLALPIAFDPVRLGVNLLLISRPRPAQNLLVLKTSPGSALESTNQNMTPNTWRCEPSSPRSIATFATSLRENAAALAPRPPETAKPGSVFHR